MQTRLVLVQSLTRYPLVCLEIYINNLYYLTSVQSTDKINVMLSGDFPAVTCKDSFHVYKFQCSLEHRPKPVRVARQFAQLYKWLTASCPNVHWLTFYLQIGWRKTHILFWHFIGCMYFNSMTLICQDTERFIKWDIPFEVYTPFEKKKKRKKKEKKTFNSGKKISRREG